MRFSFIRDNVNRGNVSTDQALKSSDFTIIYHLSIAQPPTDFPKAFPRLSLAEIFQSLNSLTFKSMRTTHHSPPRTAPSVPLLGRQTEWPPKFSKRP